MAEKTIRREQRPWARIGDMFRYAFPAAPSAVADAPKAAGFPAGFSAVFPVGLSIAYAACAAAFTATAPPAAAAAAAAAPAAPLGGARS
ncbi:hypothetical protein ACFXKS_29055 [Streptomyces scopuliridis]|uniref:hypothetical protein n=1 Tax=Streptomyces scopuliridis TaxID=452529 RepID=UPI003689E85C